MPKETVKTKEAVKLKKTVKPIVAEATESKVEPQKLDLKRKLLSKEVASQKTEVVAPVSNPIDKIIDFAFNASREKLREVTIIDRLQGRLLPLLDLVNQMWQYVLELALFRQDGEAYALTYERPRPVPPNPIDEFVYRTAQWQKSVAGKNLERAIDLALAEMETRVPDEDDIGGHTDAWGKDST